MSDVWLLRIKKKLCYFNFLGITFKPDFADAVEGVNSDDVYITAWYIE